MHSCALEDERGRMRYAMQNAMTIIEAKVPDYNRQIHRAEIRVFAKSAFPDHSGVFPTPHIVEDENAKDKHLRQMPEFRRKIFKLVPGILPHFQLEIPMRRLYCPLIFRLGGFGPPLSG